MLGNALTLHQSGDLLKARMLYERILARKPDHAETLHYLAVLSHQEGRSKRATRLLRLAISINPADPSFRLNLGKILEDQADLRGAVTAYRECIRLEPNDVDGHYNLGTALLRLDKLRDAELSLRAALAIRPEDADCHYNLAHALRRQGRLKEALAAYHTAVKLRPKWAEGLNNLGNTLLEAGDLTQAIRVYRDSLKLRPDDARSHLNLGNALRAAGETEAALAAYREALRLNSGFYEAYASLGAALNAEGRWDEGAEAFRKALALRPEARSARRGLAAALRFMSPSAYGFGLDQELRACLSSPHVYPQDLARVTAELLKCKYGIRDRSAARQQAQELALGKLCADKLLSIYLSTVINTDPELECFLTALRRRLLVDGMDGPELPEACAEFIGCLALQCSANEYLFDRSPKEERPLGVLKERLENANLADTAEIERSLLLFAMYFPLSAVAQLRALEGSAVRRFGRPLSEVMERTLFEPIAEDSLSNGIVSVGDIRDVTSQAVRVQYEENPYPRWRSLPEYEPEDVGAYLSRHFPHFSPPEFLSGPARLLVAGSGTGQEPIGLARRFKNAEVVAVDLSRRSLAYGMRMARKLGVRNVRFLQGDILALKPRDQQFHVVHCVGVLHHMAKPLQGWRVLADCLVPGGVMQVGLYSELARSAIVLARERLRQLGSDSKPEDVRAFRRRILSGVENAELAELVRSEDFYSLSACRDLLFHVQEHRYTVPQIREALADLGLAFIGFELPTKQMHSLYVREFPEDPGLSDFSAWERFERAHPRSFAGLYRFWCQKPMPEPEPGA